MKIDYKQLEFIHHILRLGVLPDVEDIIGHDSTITSIYRINDSGVHGALPVRGIDIRCHSEALGKAVEYAINAIWQYDQSRPELKVCLYHDVNQGRHLHFQVSENTKRRIADETSA